MPGVPNNSISPIHTPGSIETHILKVVSIGNTLSTALLLSRSFKRISVAVYRLDIGTFSVRAMDPRTGPKFPKGEFSVPK